MTLSHDSGNKSNQTKFRETTSEQAALAYIGGTATCGCDVFSIDKVETIQQELRITGRRTDGSETFACIHFPVVLGVEGKDLLLSPDGLQMIFQIRLSHKKCN